jgi:hypothetical protein
MSTGSFVEGIYAVFFSGTASEGYGLLVFQNGKITGADPMGVIFDGYYEIDTNIRARIDVKAPPNGTLIQGVTAGPEGLTYQAQVDLSMDFLEKPFVSVQTPLGPVNVRFKLLRGLS